MPATIKIGKDETYTGPGSEIRSVTITSEGPQIDCTVRGNSTRQYLTGLRDQTIEVDCLSGEVSVGSTATVSAGHASGTFTVMSVVKSEPLDDVVSYKLTLKRTNSSGGGGGGGS